MRRAERLFQIVQFLRKRRRAVTARVISEHFDICERTVYRDLQALMASGVPINGAAGVGYLFDKSYDLPPVLFEAEELEALALGAAMVGNWTDSDFAARARSAMGKIEAVLPEPLLARLQQEVLHSMPSRHRLSAAWCEKRRAFRNFRLDRMRNLQVLEARFEHEAGKTLQDYIASCGEG